MGTGWKPVCRDRRDACPPFLLPAVFAAGHEGPVDTGDADAAAVRALGEHDEAVTIGAKPTAVGRVRIGGAHEDVFAGGIAIKFSQLRAIPRSFFVRHR